MRTYAPRNATYTGGNRISPSPRAVTPAWVTDPASASQLSFLDSLIEGRDHDAIPAADGHVIDIIMDRMDRKPISKGEASEAITVLKTLPVNGDSGVAQRNADRHFARTGQPSTEYIFDQRGQLESVGHAAPAAPVAAPVTQDGMYLRPDGVIFKVQVAVHGSGNLYAKQLRLVPAGERRIVRGKERAAEFDYAPGAMLTLTAEMRMTIEQAKEWGALYASCVRCGLTLTAEMSVEAGMGPVCRSKI